MKIISVLFCFVLLFITSVYGQTIIYVKSDAVGLNNGTSWTNAYTSLQSALSAATSGKQIWVAAGTYKPTEGIDRNISFTMKKNVAIYGGFAGTETSVNQRTSYGAGEANETILSGDIGNIDDNSDNSYHVINNPFELYLSSSAILDGFTITGGNGGTGGGMYNIWCNPTINNCTFKNNAASTGNPEGGGAIYNYASAPIITNCTFIGNTAVSLGGAIYNDGYAPTITNCIFKGNNAFYGGGVYNFNVSPSIINCIFSGNSAGLRGGGVSNYGSSANPSIINCTFCGNSASYGGGLSNEVSASPIVKNTIFWGNNSQISGGSNFTYCCIQGGSGTFTGEGNIFVDPLFADGDGADNTYGTSDDDFRLQHESPCVNSGITGNGVPGEDIIGINRRSRPDIGAYEHPGIIYVNQNAGSGTNNGTSWSDAYLSFQTAFNEAKSSDTIWVAAGTYKPTTGLDRSVSFQLKNNVAVYGGFAGTETYINQRTNFGAGQANETILSGDIGTAGNNIDNSYHVIYLPDGLGLNTSAVLDGFTITGGYANGSDPHNRGGGIYSINNSFTLTNCAVKNNTASWDCGGAYLNNSSPVITNCSITNNTGAYGAGIYSGSGSPVVRNCIISGNTINNSTGRGAGIALFGSNMLIESSTISFNTTPDDGGGMHIDHSSPTVKNCLINNNSSKHGGGVNIIWDESDPVFYNCTFAKNNTSWGDGGAAVKAVEGGDANFYNCIFWGNYISGTGAENEIYLHDGSNIYLRYSCFYDQNNSIGIFGTGYFNASDHSLYNADPLFADAANGNFHLSPGSPCISAGLNPGGNNIPTTDIDGRIRPMGSGTDIGAYECNDDAALPVELISFYANTIGKDVELNWETATEINNYGFEIERTVSSQQYGVESKWEKIGFVPGNGNSNSPKEYSFADVNPVAGYLQYRIKQIDTDGNSEYYSTIAEINFSVTNVKQKQLPKEYTLEQNYPNPFNPATIIRFGIPAESKVALEIYNIIGERITKLLDNELEAGYHEVKFQMNGLPSGIYFYRINVKGVVGNKEFHSIKKMIYLK